MESLEIFNEILINNNLPPLTEDEAKEWNVHALSANEAWQAAHDLVSEEHTVRQENKNAWMYEL